MYVCVSKVTRRGHTILPRITAQLRKGPRNMINFPLQLLSYEMYARSEWIESSRIWYFILFINMLSYDIMHLGIYILSRRHTIHEKHACISIKIKIKNYAINR